MRIVIYLGSDPKTNFVGAFYHGDNVRSSFAAVCFVVPGLRSDFGKADIREDAVFNHGEMFSDVVRMKVHK